MGISFPAPPLLWCRFSGRVSPSTAQGPCFPLGCWPGLWGDRSGGGLAEASVWVSQCPLRGCLTPHLDLLGRNLFPEGHSLDCCSAGANTCPFRHHTGDSGSGTRSLVALCSCAVNKTRNLHSHVQGRSWERDLTCRWSAVAGRQTAPQLQKPGKICMDF